MTLAERVRLTAVARGDAPADLYVRGGTLLNVYTGEIARANVAIAGERIAYVGLREDMCDARTRVVDAKDRILVPGYIDPHAHPAHLVTPSEFARYVLPLGTTSVFADTLQFFELGGEPAFRRVADTLARSPLKFYWMIRVHAQSRTAGAAAEKLPAIAAGGVTSDHEAITAEEVLGRARLGIAVMLRESSLRPDLAGLLDALKQAPALASRAMLTADGSMPAFVRAHGFTDHLLRIALGRGVAPIDAYRMVTLNPATYYGLEADLGGIAPGRYADLCLLEDLAEPRPVSVIARGRLAATRGTLEVGVPEPVWSRVFTTSRARLTGRWRVRPEDFALPSRERYPVIRFISAVITRLEERPLAEGDLFAALVDREGRWVAPAVVAGVAERLDGLATTTSTDFNVIALGRDPRAMARAVNRVLDLHGGIALVDGDRTTFELGLPIGGIMARVGYESAADSEQRFHTELTARGYAYHDPLFTLFFLPADFLPAVRLTPRGVWDVKRTRVLLPSRRRTGAR